MKNKIVMVTGASAGIGRETAFLFAKEGAHLVLTYNKSQKDAQNVEKHCLNLGARDVLLLNLNLRDDSSIKKAVEDSIAATGRIDILINNAGTGVFKPLKEQNFQDIEDQLRTNLEGLIKITRCALPYIKESILNISSGAGIQAFADYTVYCASKFGVRGFTQALAEELPNIKILCINPGMTSTRMTKFQGVSAEKVAQVILDSAKGKFKVPSGSDINVWEVLKTSMY